MRFGGVDARSVSVSEDTPQKAKANAKKKKRNLIKRTRSTKHKQEIPGGWREVIQ